MSDAKKTVEKMNNVESKDEKYKSAGFVFHWKNIFVGATIGCVIGALIGLIITIKVNNDYRDLSDKYDELVVKQNDIKRELKEYKEVSSNSSRQKNRYNSFIKKIEKAGKLKMYIEQMDLVTYYHPWESDSIQYERKWRIVYRQVRTALYQFADYNKKRNTEAGVKELIRIGIWSEINGELTDAKNTFTEVTKEDYYTIEQIGDYQRLYDKGILDRAFIGLGYARKYQVPEDINRKTNKEIYEILIEWDDEWVKPKRLKELKELEKKARESNK